MPARVLVFCKRSVAHLTAESLLHELKAADLMSLAESLELPEGEEAAVEEMWQRLRIEGGEHGLGSIEIHWHGTQRPIQVGCEPPLHGEIDETLEDLPEDDTQAARRVREHLRATLEVVDFEMGIDGSHHLAATITEVLAFYLAREGDGLVWFYHREFASPDDPGEALWITED
jgi:hypothetical protein